MLLLQCGWVHVQSRPKTNKSLAVIITLTEPTHNPQIISVEPAGDRRPGGMGGGGGGRGGYDDRPRGGGGGKRTDFRVVVTNLPERTSWQDLKDFFRPVGDVGFTDVDQRNGEGVVEFMYKEDMKKAIRKLDRTTMRNPFAE